MQYTINELRQEAFKNVYLVYEVFQNYFGEGYTDLQHLPSDDEIAGVLEDKHVTMREDGSCYEGNGRQFNSVKNALAVWRPFILVWWPRVKVTNENNKSINIYDLYAKIELDYKGNIPAENVGFLLNRATYPLEQWMSNYMHSHINTIPQEDLEKFQLPCLGSGPINETIRFLKTDVSEGFDEIRWMLFCEELARYVTVESLKGIPYRYLERVHISDALCDYGQFDNKRNVQLEAIRNFNTVFNKETLEAFIQYYLKYGHLSIGYQEGKFVCGMSYFDYIIDISNTFIEYFNKNVIDEAKVGLTFFYHILKECVVADGKFFEVSGQRTVPDVSPYVGQKICDFKSNKITLHIINSSTQEPQKTTILNHGLAMFILNNILKIINYRYTNEYTRQHRQGADSNQSESTSHAPTHQRVYYL